MKAAVMNDEYTDGTAGSFIVPHASFIILAFVVYSLLKCFSKWRKFIECN